MELGLKDKIAIVTGSSKGMGKAVARQLAANGAKVCLVARDAEGLAAAAKDVSHEDSSLVMTQPGDVSDPGLPAKVVKSVVARWGKVDILVNNAGGPPPGGFLEHNDAVWESALQQNFLGAVRFARAVAPLMKEQKWGRIITIASTIAKEPHPSMVLSASSRAAIAAFSKAIAIELAPFNVTVNTVCPGSVSTDRAVSLLRQAAVRTHRPFEEILAESERAIPIRRFATVEEIAAAVVFLASQQASYVTGVSLMVDGGLTKSVF